MGRPVQAPQPRSEKRGVDPLRTREGCSGMKHDRSRSRVTPHQARVYELRHQTEPPRPWREIGRLLGQGEDVANVRKAYRRAVANMELDAARPISAAETPHVSSGCEAKRVRAERLDALWGTRAEQSLAGMTTEKLEKASLRDLAVMAGIATDKLLLLRGQPTEIVRTEADRMDLQALVAEFLVEAKRRNVEIDVSPSGAAEMLKSGL